MYLLLYIFYKGEMKEFVYLLVCCLLNCVEILLLLLASWQEVGYLHQVVGEELPFLQQSSFVKKLSVAPPGLQVKISVFPANDRM